MTGVAEHVSSCKLMFSSETEDLNTKMFTKSMNFPVKNLALVSLCTKNVNFKTWNWFLIENGRSRPKTTSESHNDRIGFCRSLKPVCFGLPPVTSPLSCILFKGVFFNLNGVSVMWMGFYNFGWGIEILALTF